MNPNWNRVYIENEGENGMRVYAYVKGDHNCRRDYVQVYIETSIPTGWWVIWEVGPITVMVSEKTIRREPIWLEAYPGLMAGVKQAMRYGEEVYKDSLR